MNRKSHWESIYSTKNPTQVSWYQQRPEVSLEMIERTKVGKAANIIDIGGGASTLADHLLAMGFARVTVLDISMAAIRAAQERLGPKAEAVEWIEADITEAVLPARSFDLWHDRAVFHFLIEEKDRRKYVEQATHALKDAGHLILAAFASDGPTRCSGLDVVRYTPEALQEEMGGAFELMETTRETHLTPSGSEQRFIYCRFRKR
ncbi:MAG: class I SAM-dependent methyltransferase [Blastocatellia bacterium]|nr:class I SAM-dependent methyltransferase [Blastocatellia bacterium]